MNGQRCAFEGQDGPCSEDVPLPGMDGQLSCACHRFMAAGHGYRPDPLWDAMARAAYVGEWTHERDPVTGLPVMLRMRPFDELPQEERARWWRDMAALAEWCEWLAARQEYEAVIEQALGCDELVASWCSPWSPWSADMGVRTGAPPPYPGAAPSRKPETLGDIAAVAIARDRAKPTAATHGWEPASRLDMASGGVLDVLSDSLGGPARREGETDQELRRRVLAEMEPPQRGTLESLVPIIRDYPHDLTFAQEAEMMERLDAARPAGVTLRFMSDVQNGERFFRVRVSGAAVDIIERRRDGVTTRRDEQAEASRLCRCDEEERTAGHRESCPLAIPRL